MSARKARLPPALRAVGMAALALSGFIVGSTVMAVASDDAVDAEAWAAILGGLGPVATAVAAGLAAWGVVHTNAQRADEAREAQLRSESDHWWAHARWAVELAERRQWRAVGAARNYLVESASSDAQLAFIEGAIAPSLRGPRSIPEAAPDAY